MQAEAKLRFVRISSQKCRLVADQIRGKRVDQAMQTLNFSPKKSARILQKVLESAIANAENNAGADIDALKIASITVDEGPAYKRMRAGAKGRGNPISKRTSHITVTVADE